MDFKGFKALFQANFQRLTNACKVIVVADIDKDELWNTYIAAFPLEEQASHICNSCRQFIKNYGGIVGIDDSFQVRSIWDFEGAEDEYTNVPAALTEYVLSKGIKDGFVSSTQRLGNDYNFAEGLVRWDHFFLILPDEYRHRGSESEDSVRGTMRSTVQVFKRALDEIQPQAVQTVLDLIADNNLYRGSEYAMLLGKFQSVQEQYNRIHPTRREAFVWSIGIKGDQSVVRIRSTAIGTLLVNLSEGMDLDQAIRQFESIMAPANYKRPKAIVSKAMLEAAEKTIKELGLEAALARRFATITDISANDVMYMYTKPLGGIFDQLKDDTLVNPNSHKDVQVINLDLLKNLVIPNASLIEVLVENRHKNNFMTLLTAEDPEASLLFKWGNPFSWSYANGVTDSIKENVKKAGGKVDGVLRFSIQWNDDDTKSRCDLDAHAIEPDRTHIYYRSYKGSHNRTSMGGNLDVDMISPSTVGVENITWPDKSRMKYGKYIFYVNPFSGVTNGFKAQIEADGVVYDFTYNGPLRNDVHVAEVTYSEKGFEVKSLIPSNSSVSSTEVWGVGSNKFHKVNLITKSPNFWDGKSIGNEHLFFIIDKVKHEGPVRGIYNEFLKQELDQHRKVFELLGSKLTPKPADEELSGLGFSSTNKDEVIIRATHDNRKRVYRVKF